MPSVMKKCIMGLGVAATLVATASPADAQYRRHYRGYRHDNTGVAIGAGILGLGIGAAIASSNRGYYGGGYGYSDPYYGGYSSGYGYSDPYYGSYGGYGAYSGYNGYYGNGYGYRCTTHRQWDPYWRRWVRVRSC